MSKKLIGTIIIASFLMAGGGIFMVAQADNENSTSNTSNRDEHSTSTKNTPKITDIACVQTAVDKRETAIASAWNSLNSSINSALSARKDALKTAWTIPDANQRKTAIKTAWKNFKSADKAARTAFKRAQKAAWTQFKTDAKACRVSNVYDEQGSDIQI
ncbi:MAG: hypothetical protein Q7R46_01300 [bacterium]|nr:hypothetical protein [bacterium]